ncbi:hypothetical protein [Halocatena marina]|uniref:hypothetical protein n=1 Tax=Halocatena marina TaxID=2934937 RepID=UPI00200D8B18|nr:hypothetical protein [Halocatena marina]
MLKTHQRATTQALVDDYLEGDAPHIDTQEGDNTRPKETFERPVNVHPDVDPSQEVFRSDRRYHTCVCGIPGCPEARDLSRTSIAVCARLGIDPCEKCDPVDYRIEKDELQNATLEDFR